MEEEYSGYLSKVATEAVSEQFSDSSHGVCPRVSFKNVAKDDL